MNTITEQTKLTFFKVMYGQVAINDFEQWVYTTEELEQQLPADTYLDILSLNYQKPEAKYELFNILKREVDLGEYETFKLNYLLTEAKLRNEQLPDILEQFYDLYCKGYSFLENLGMGLCLSMPCLSHELSKDQIMEIVGTISVVLEEELQRVSGWLIDRKIILTGEQDELKRYDYIDNRNNYEKKARSTHPIFNPNKRRRWWHFGN